MCTYEVTDAPWVKLHVRQQHGLWLVPLREGRQVHVQTGRVPLWRRVHVRVVQGLPVRQGRRVHVQGPVQVRRRVHVLLVQGLQGLGLLLRLGLRVQACYCKVALRLRVVVVVALRLRVVVALRRIGRAQSRGCALNVPARHAHWRAGGNGHQPQRRGDCA